MPRIINFHRVSDAGWLEEVICLLKSKYRLVTIESLHESYLCSRSGNNSCHITADDGDKSFYDVVFPVLQKHKAPASIYVSPRICKEESNYWFQEVAGCNQIQLKRIIADMMDVPFDLLNKYSVYSILKTRPIFQILETIRRYQKITHTGRSASQNMTVDNLKEVDRSGLVTIGAHTINHPVLRIEDDAYSKHEIDASVGELSDILQHDVKYFAYPNGIPALDFTKREQRYLKDIGIHLALTTESRSISSIDDPTSIPRIAVSDAESLSYLKTKLALSSFWNVITRVKPNGEYRERQELGRVIPAAKPPVM